MRLRTYIFGGAFSYGKKKLLEDRKNESRSL